MNSRPVIAGIGEVLWDVYPDAAHFGVIAFSDQRDGGVGGFGLAHSGDKRERKNAKKVLQLLQRGKHWVLVTLLLSNVITNETLPIVLDREVKGGWFAVLVSSLLIVVFGEIIPSSICAKYGLSVGAWSSRFGINANKFSSNC